MTQQQRPDSVELVEIGEKAELFHDPDGRTYATFQASVYHRETWAMESKSFRSWIQRQFYNKFDRTPGEGQMQQALLTLHGRAVHDGPEYRVFIRLGEHEGVIYLDLCNNKWEIVQISSESIKLLDYKDCPIRFRRSKGSLPLAAPQAPKNGESPIHDLMHLLNIGSEDNWVMLISWLTACFHPTGPYPMLALHGPAGSSKSTTARMLRALVDPNRAPLRSPPRSDQELNITACNSWTVCIDNLSKVTNMQSDALCRLSTGGGFGSRQLYTDADEFIVDACRPVIITGIDDFISRDDMLDRCLIVHLPPIQTVNRRTETDIWGEFEQLRPYVLWQILEAVQEALANKDVVRQIDLPRMADFASWIIAAEDKLPWEDGDFLEAYQENRLIARELGLAGVAIGEPLVEWVKAKGEVSGSAADILEELNVCADYGTRKHAEWPQTPLQLSNMLRRAMTSLQDAGVSVRFRRSGGQRILELKWVGGVTYIGGSK